jgi:hypothetical protein
MACTVMALAGCSDSLTSFTPSDDPYLSLSLNARRAVMSTVAPYNTLQLVPMPRTASGAALTDSVEVQYTTQDTTLAVTPDGLVTALHPTSSSWVLARVRDLRQGITHVDTLYVRITTATPSAPLKTFAIQRPAGDSAKIGIYNSTYQYALDTVRVAATAENGTDLLPDVWVRYAVSDSAIAKVDPNKGIVTGLRLGQVTVYATTTYYGVTKTDSLRMTIGYPVAASVYVQYMASPTVVGEYIRYFSPSTITIGVGGTIFFRALSSFAGPDLDTDVVFDDPSAAQPSLLTGLSTGSGNIGPIPSRYLNGVLNPACVPSTVCNGESRSFPVAGTYHYHSALYGTSGTIIVITE